MTTTLVEELVPEELWQSVAPLIPAPPRPPYGGRRRTIRDRNCLAAIVYMARTSTPWRLLPVGELGCGSPATVWRRLEEWAKAGVFDALHLEMLDLLGEQGRLDWTRASVDTMSVRAKRGGTMWAQIPSTAANQDLSSTWSPTARACRWRPQSPQPTPTTVWCLRRCLMTSRRYAPRAVGGVAGPPRSTPIRGMTLGTAAPICDGVGSRLGSHAVGSSRRSGWGGTAGGWSGRCPG
jgi:transposase